MRLIGRGPGGIGQAGTTPARGLLGTLEICRLKKIPSFTFVIPMSTFEPSWAPSRTAHHLGPISTIHIAPHLLQSRTTGHTHKQAVRLPAAKHFGGLRSSSQWKNSCEPCLGARGRLDPRSGPVPPSPRNMQNAHVSNLCILGLPSPALSASRLPSLEGSPTESSAFVSSHSNCLVVHYQNEQPNYQQRKENNDDDRNNGIPASERLAIGRFGSGFLRRSDTQQEAHLIPRSLNPAQADRRRRIALNAFAYAFAIANSIPARCRRHRFGRVYGSRRTIFLIKRMLPTITGSGSAPGAGG